LINLILLQDGKTGIGIDWKGLDDQINSSFYECQDHTKAKHLKISQPFAAVIKEERIEPVKKRNKLKLS
jgi:hypothetical protein